MNNQLEKFIEVFPLTRVTLYQEFCVYKVGKGLAKRAAQEANEVIEQLGLPLVAIPSSLINADSFFVQSNEIGYV